MIRPFNCFFFRLHVLSHTSSPTHLVTCLSTHFISPPIHSYIWSPNQVVWYPVCRAAPLPVCINSSFSQFVFGFFDYFHFPSHSSSHPPIKSIHFAQNLVINYFCPEVAKSDYFLRHYFLLYKVTNDVAFTMFLFPTLLWLCRWGGWTRPHYLY